MAEMIAWLGAHLRIRDETSEKGQAMVEYAFILVLCSIAAVIAVKGFSLVMQSRYYDVIGTMFSG